MDEVRLPPVRLRLDEPEERALYEGYQAVPASRRAEWLRRALLRGYDAGRSGGREERASREMIREAGTTMPVAPASKLKGIL